jgi:hypothetical protein
MWSHPYLYHAFFSAKSFFVFSHFFSFYTNSYVYIIRNPKPWVENCYLWLVSWHVNTNNRIIYVLESLLLLGIVLLFLFYFFFLITFNHRVQVGLKFMILIAQSPKCRDFRCFLWHPDHLVFIINSKTWFVPGKIYYDSN